LAASGLRPELADATPFSAEYEALIRRQTGRPEDGTEYLVRHNDEQAFFDATDVPDRGGVSTEVLVDGKGLYEQFIDPNTGDFERWWRATRSRPASAARSCGPNGRSGSPTRPVGWWCAERATADAFNDAFANNPNLRGRIVAVHKPMP
jgi:hypothetical protein